MKDHKPFIVASVRDLLNQLHNEEITFSRMVEIMNEISYKYCNETGSGPAAKKLCIGCSIYEPMQDSVYCEGCRRETE